MGVPRLWAELELQLLASVTATATQGPSHICDLHCNSRQPLTHRGRPGIEPTSSWILVGFITTEPQWELQKLCYLELSCVLTFLLTLQIDGEKMRMLFVLQRKNGHFF